MYSLVRKLEFICKGQVLTKLWFFLLEKVSKCKTCYDGYIYPQYGMAPHKHDLKITGNIIGSTVLDKRKEWPKYFVEDKNCPGCGMWYCSNKNCVYGNEKYKCIKCGDYMGKIALLCYPAKIVMKCISCSYQYEVK